MPAESISNNHLTQVRDDGTNMEVATTTSICEVILEDVDEKSFDEPIVLSRRLWENATVTRVLAESFSVRKVNQLDVRVPAMVHKIA